MVLACDYSWARPSPAAIYDAGYRGVLRYLSGDPSSGKDLTTPEADALHAAGLGIRLVWETTGTDFTGGFEQGVADGKAANAEADALGYPSDLPLFYAIDTDVTDGAAVLPYFSGIKSADGRAPLAYGDATVISALAAAGYGNGWQTMAWSGSTVSSQAALLQRTTPTLTIAGAAPGSWDEDVVLQPIPWWGTAPPAPVQLTTKHPLLLVTPSGVVTTTGGTPYKGDMYSAGFSGLSGSKPIPAPVVSVASVPTGGYLLALSDGGVSNFGTTWYGSPKAANASHVGSVVGIATTKSGYLVVTSGGNVFNYNTPWYGSPIAAKAAHVGSVVGIAATQTGYLVVTSGGNVFNYNTPWYGSPIAKHADMAGPIVGIATTETGYLVVSEAGNVFNYNTDWYGSNVSPGSGVVGIASVPGGYYVARSDGTVEAFGTAEAKGAVPGPIVGIAAA